MNNDSLSVDLSSDTNIACKRSHLVNEVLGLTRYLWIGVFKLCSFCYYVNGIK